MTDKKTEALKLALEALEAAEKHHTTTSLPQAIKNYGSRDAHAKAGFETWLTIVPHAITAIREALAEQPAQQEPVATNKVYVTREQLAELYPPPIYPAPAALQMDVIVANLVREGINKHRARELAEHFIKHVFPPASKPWVGLTESERADLRYEADIGPDAIIKATEAKLREKNA